MEGLVFRPDYYKVILVAEPDLMTQYRNLLNTASHTFKADGDFLTSHKWSYLYHQPDGREVMALELWGEWAALPLVFSDPVWLRECRRIDYRATLWEQSTEGVFNLGVHLTTHASRYNTVLRSSKPRTKRGGRDAGGKGFSIGSHKSDLRVSMYTRGQGRPALEYQCSGGMLQSFKAQVVELCGPKADVIDYWLNLKTLAVAAGDKRLLESLESAGIGTYWPALHEAEAPELPALQPNLITPELFDVFPDDVPSDDSWRDDDGYDPTLA